MDTSPVDFRLLVCLQVLVAEGHVTKAAERLGMTQPRLSGVLARLRQITGDPLLVRTPKGMVATDLARELAGESSEFMLRWNALLHSEAVFAAETAKKIFRVEAPDFVMRSFLPDLIKALRESAPGISLSLSTPHVATLRERLELGEIDLYLGYIRDPPPDLFVSYLLPSHSKGLISTHHPRLEGDPSLDEFGREGHVALTFGRSHELSFSEQLVDSALRDHGVDRRILMFAPSSIIMPEIVASTDLLALVPAPVAREAVHRLPLRIFDPPFEVPHRELRMIWHTRTKNEPASRWFRGLVRRVAQGTAASATWRSDSL